MRAAGAGCCAPQRLIARADTSAIAISSTARGGWSFRFFTIWNYTALVLVFWALLAHSVAMRWGHTLPRWFSMATAVLFEVELTNVLVVDVVYWTLLYNGSADFEDVNVHLVNAFWMYGELALNGCTVHFGTVIFVLFYALAYVWFTWFLYIGGSITAWPQVPAAARRARRAHPPRSYSFMDTSSKVAGLWYCGLAVGFILAHGGAYGAGRVKTWYLARFEPPAPSQQRDDDACERTALLDPAKDPEAAFLAKRPASIAAGDSAA